MDIAALQRVAYVGLIIIGAILGLTWGLRLKQQLDRQMRDRHKRDRGVTDA